MISRDKQKKLLTESTQYYLEPSDFLSFNYHRVAYYVLGPKNKWIGFWPVDAGKRRKIEKENGNNYFGYKIHIEIPKNVDYEKHITGVLEIIDEYQFFFKIDAHLKDELWGERAFTIFLPHLFNRYWFEALKKVDQYLSKELRDIPSEYSSDGTAKKVSCFNHIRYRNDRAANGEAYARNSFDNECELSVDNPFRPDLVNLLNEIYNEDISLYQEIASDMHNDIKDWEYLIILKKINNDNFLGFCEFLIKLTENNNNDNFLFLLKNILDNPKLHRIVSSLIWYNQNQNDTIAENLVNNLTKFNKILRKLEDKSICPAYHALTEILDKQSNDDTAFSIETKKIRKTIEAIIVNALYNTFILKQPFEKADQSKAQEEIYKEINLRLVNNESLEVNKSKAKYLASTLLNTLPIVPFVGWSLGATKYCLTGSFWFSDKEKEKTKKQKEIESSLINSLNANTDIISITRNSKG